MKSCFLYTGRQFNHWMQLPIHGSHQCHHGRTILLFFFFKRFVVRMNRDFFQIVREIYIICVQLSVRRVDLVLEKKCACPSWCTTPRSRSTPVWAPRRMTHLPISPWIRWRHIWSMRTTTTIARWTDSTHWSTRSTGQIQACGPSSETKRGCRASTTSASTEAKRSELCSYKTRWPNI